MGASLRSNKTQLLLRPGQAPVPVPVRVGEPSVFQHVLYILKENKTYDQMLGEEISLVSNSRFAQQFTRRALTFTVLSDRGTKVLPARRAGPRFWRAQSQHRYSSGVDRSVIRQLLPVRLFENFG